MFNITNHTDLTKNAKLFIAENNQAGLDFIKNEITKIYENKKYYEFWGVTADTSISDIESKIKTNMRALSFTFHPDRQQDEKLKEWGGHIYALINKMADTIRTPELKKAFDEELLFNQFSYSTEYRKYSADEILDELAESNKKAQSQKFNFNINDYMPNFNKGKSFSDTLDVHFEVEVPLEDYLLNDYFTINLNYSELNQTKTIEKCLHCNGASMFDAPDSKNGGCHVCDGKGFIYTTDENFNRIKSITLQANNHYVQNSKIKLDGFGLEKQGIKGDAYVTINFISNKKEYYLMGNVISYHVYPTVTDLLNDRKIINIFDKELTLTKNELVTKLELTDKTVYTNQIRQLDNEFSIKGKKIHLTIHPISISEEEIKKLLALSQESKQAILKLINE